MDFTRAVSRFVCVWLPSTWASGASGESPSVIISCHYRQSGGGALWPAESRLNAAHFSSGWHVAQQGGSLPCHPAINTNTEQCVALCVCVCVKWTKPCAIVCLIISFPPLKATEAAAIGLRKSASESHFYLKQMSWEHWIWLITQADIC